MKLHIRESLC